MARASGSFRATAGGACGQGKELPGRDHRQRRARGSGNHAGFSSWLGCSGRNRAKRAKKRATGTGGNGPESVRRTGRA
ncbi:MAG: hypothetical protein AVDCRST_MAG56-1950 [uncultured Cytophagales bacterium]|uniref:Uncharacterized protein n=1 Tax=uncultured Cytophagales bacterium TaxID=158755 RepID=A0A6J4IFH3_9SPHI|nr:MAG: hypothetical protein AVDCRST_MAG56-1950 [uncultured Cytophagales bacterium]